MNKNYNYSFKKTTLLSVVFLFILSLILFLPKEVSAFSNNPVEEMWVTDNTVMASVEDPDNNLIYIGGYFTWVGPDTGYGARVNSSTGQIITTPPLSNVRPNGTIYAAISDGLGGFYIGGDFTKIGTTTKTRIAHILSNGELDTSFNLSPNGTVYSLALSSDGSILYLGGNFTSLGLFYPRNALAAVNTSTSVPTSFNPNANGIVYTLSLSSDNSILYAGGAFTTIGGQSRNRLAALDTSTGLATTFDPNANNTVLTLALSSDGSTLYAGGTFTTIGGQSRNYIAALDTSTGSATSFNPNASSTVRALSLTSDNLILYAGGDFYTIGGQSRNFIAALDTSTGLATAFNPNANNTVRILVLSSDNSVLYIGGRFTTIGGQPRNYIAALDTSTGLATSFNPNAKYWVYALALSSDNSLLYVGGNFTSIGGQTRNRLAAIDTSTGQATSFNPNANEAVRTLALSSDGSILYAGGSFTSIGGQTRARLAALNTSTGLATTFNPNASNSVFDLALSSDGTILYAGGSFTTIGGQSRNYLAALDTSTGLATSFNPNANSTVNALALSSLGSTLYAGGSFTTIGGQSRNFIAALDTSTGSATAFDPNANNALLTLALSSDGSTLYAGGSFTSIGGQPRNRLAALDTSTGLATAFDPNADYTVNTLSLTSDNLTLYAGGQFNTIGGQSRNQLAEIDIATSQATAFNPNMGGSVNTITISSNGSTLYVGGQFSTVGGKSRPYFAAFRGALNKLVFTTSAQTLNVGQVSSIITVQVQDLLTSVPVNVDTDTTINLTSTSPQGKFYSDAGGTNEITSITIFTGQNSASFYYKDNTPGTPTITAAESPSQGWPDANQQETIEQLASRPQFPPSAPIIEKPEVLSESSIKWCFIDRSNNENGFILYDRDENELGTAPAAPSLGTEICITETDLTPNTQVSGRYVRSWSNIGKSAPSEEAESAWTFAAIPLKPELEVIDKNRIDLIVNENNNPTQTEFAIFEVTTEKWVQALTDEETYLSENPVWLTKEGWGGENGIIISGLKPKTAYTFQVKARNNNLIESSFSESSSIETPKAVPILSLDFTAQVIHPKITVLSILRVRPQTTGFVSLIFLGFFTLSSLALFEKTKKIRQILPKNVSLFYLLFGLSTKKIKELMIDSQFNQQVLLNQFKQYRKFSRGNLAISVFFGIITLALMVSSPPANNETETPIQIKTKDTIAFTATLTNEGEEKATDVILESIIPDGFNFKSESLKVDGESRTALVEEKKLKVNLDEVAAKINDTPGKKIVQWAGEVSENAPKAMIFQAKVYASEIAEEIQSDYLKFIVAPPFTISPTTITFTAIDEEPVEILPSEDYIIDSCLSSNNKIAAVIDKCKIKPAANGSTTITVRAKTGEVNVAEVNVLMPVCADGLDNDNDDLIDLSDYGCINKTDNNEWNAICGNKICETGENYLTCSDDCKTSPICGNKICETGEDFQNCPTDCPQTLPTVAVTAPEIIVTPRGENITNNSQPSVQMQITGYGVAESQEIEIILNGKVVDTVLAEPGATITWKPERSLPDGVYSLTTSLGGELRFEVDTKAPEASLGSATIEKIETAFLETHELTRLPLLTLRPRVTATIIFSGHISDEDWQRGVSQARITIESDLIEESFVPNAQDWKHTISAVLDQGKHKATLTYVDFAQNESAKSPPLEFEIKLPQCMDKIDNDEDGLIDFPLDPDCQNNFDDNEAKIPIENILQSSIVQNIFNNPLIENINTNFFAPVLIIVVLSNALVAISFVNFLLYLRLLLQYLRILFTQPLLLLSKRKRKGWGIVYNSLTKMPLDLALVRLTDANTGRIIQTRVTDRNGRYIFLVGKPGEYRITVTKIGFTFPSIFLKNKNADLGWTDLYHGEIVKVKTKGEVITRNIPIDPQEKTTLPIEVIKKNRKLKIHKTVSLSGLFFSFLSFAVSPTIKIFSFIILHLLIFLLFKRLSFGRRPKSWGIVFDSLTKKPISHCVVRIFDPEYNKLLETQITDSRGRYAFLVGRSRYYLTFDKPGYKLKQTNIIDLSLPGKEEVIGLDINLEK